MRGKAIDLTPELDARLRELWADTTKTFEDMGFELSISHDTIRKLGRRLGFGPRPSENGWTEARIATLVKLWDQGCSASEIAKTLGLASRGAVVGKIHRLRDAGHAFKRAHVPQAVRNARAKAKGNRPTQTRTSLLRPQAAVFGETRVPLIIAGGGVVLEKPEGQPPLEIIRADAFKPLPGSSPKPWPKRGRNQCSWIVEGGSPDALACCEPIVKGGWCFTHARIGYAPSQPKGGAKGLMRRFRRVA